jgi:acyl carrier protein
LLGVRHILSALLLFALSLGACDQSNRATAPATPPATAPATAPAKTDPETLSAVVASISAVLKIPEAEISPDVPLAKLSRSPDDLDLVEILMTIEERLGVEASNDALVAAVGGSDVHMSERLTPRIIADVMSRQPRKQKST